MASEVAAGVLAVAIGLCASVAAAQDTEIVIDGVVRRADHERVIERPFEVPRGVGGLDVTLEHDGRAAMTVLDLGLRGPSGLRGWSGGSLTHLSIGPLSASAGYLPGAIEPGTWHVLLGVPNVREGVTTTYRVLVRRLAAPPLSHPLLRNEPGWYAGDLHAHSGHSDGRNRSASSQDVAGPVHCVIEAAVRAGLDFLAVTDHNTVSHWLDIDRLQPYYDRLLLLHAREITTYHGHLNAIGERSFTEFHPRGRDVAGLLDQWNGKHVFLSINHPLAPDDERCMGCGWNDTSDDAIAKVHGVEVWNGSTDHRTFWMEQLAAGRRLTAVGGSDEHRPADGDDGRHIGTPTTMVYASALSEDAIVEGLRSGRVYVLPFGGRSPGLDFSAWIAGVEVAMGGAFPLRQREAVELRATVRGARGQKLLWLRSGAVFGLPESIAADEVELKRGVVAEPGDWYSLRLEDGHGVSTLTANAVRFPRATPP